MTRLAAWRTSDGQATRLPRSEVALEAHLEDWLATDPSMVGLGLEVIARQLHLEGGRLDLLALDPQDRLLVIEVKRAGLYREVLTQALGYTASLNTEPTADLNRRITDNAQKWGFDLPDDLADRLGEPGETREVLSVVVGCGMEAGTDDLIQYLSGEHGVPIRAVSFEVFDLGAEQVLVREVTEVDQEPEHSAGGASVEAVVELAEQAGIGPAFRQLIETIDRHSDRLYARAFPKSIMCAPAANRTRVLFNFTVKTDAKGRVKVWVEPPAFNEWFGVAEDEVREVLGAGHVWLRPEEVSPFLAQVNRLLDQPGEGAG